MLSGPEIAEKIKERAKGKNISVADMLESCGINKNGLFIMQNRGSIPKADTLGKIADALSCSVDYLLGRTDVMEVGRIVEQTEVLPDDEAVLLDRYRSCDEGGKEIIRAYALTVLRDIEKERITPICGAEGVQEQGQARSSAGGGSTGGV